MTAALIRKWFVAGLLVWIPLGATLLVIRFLVGVLDTSLLLIPQPLRPDFPGLGVLLSVVLVLGTGLIAANLIGNRVVGWIEAMVARIPLVRSIYGGVKKLAETLFSESSVSFRHAVLLEWPRKGIWTVGFITADPVAQFSAKTGQDLLTAFVPATPNPTSGFLVLVPRNEVTYLDMNVTEAMRLVISLGVVPPEATMRGSFAANPPRSNP